MARSRHLSYPDVWTLVCRIPRGAVATYGQIAKLLGIPGRARFVGYALHALPPGAPVPWHRVVSSRGTVSLPGESGWTQVALLEREGVSVPAGGIDLARWQWKPAAGRRMAGKAASSRVARRGASRG